MRTLTHKNTTSHKDIETRSENIFRLIGVLLMILGIVITMLLMDFKLFV